MKWHGFVEFVKTEGFRAAEGQALHPQGRARIRTTTRAPAHLHNEGTRLARGFSRPKCLLGFSFGKTAVVAGGRNFLPSSPLSPALVFFLRVKKKKTKPPRTSPPSPYSPGLGDPLCDGGAGRGDSAGAAELGNPMAQEGRDSLVFAALVRFLGRPQATRFRQTPQRANLFRGPKRKSPFYVTAL